MIKNQKGFSLIQVIVLAGIGVIISAIVSTIAVNTAKIANTLESRTNLKIFHEMVNDTLSSPDGCQIQGGSIPFNLAAAQTPAGPGTSNPFPSPASSPGLPIQFDFSGKSLGPNVGEGYTAPVSTSLKLKINYFRIHNAKLLWPDPLAPASQLYSAELWMQASRTNEGYGAQDSKVFSVGALTLGVVGGAVTTCSKVSSHPFVQCGIQGKIYVGPMSATTPSGVAPDANGCAPISNFGNPIVGPPVVGPPTYGPPIVGPPTYGPPTYGPPTPAPVPPSPSPKPSDFRLKQDLEKFNDEAGSAF